MECDLHAYLPEMYVPGASERMLLYRELDGLESDEELEGFRRRLLDRFGPLPAEAEELLRIGPLRRLGRRCGAERLVLKSRAMTLFFVANAQSPFYQSGIFSRILAFATSPANMRRCELGEKKGKRYIRIKNVGSVDAAVAILGHFVKELPQNEAEM